MPWRKINEMPSVFADAIRNQSLGFVSEPIKTGSGFHLLKLEEKRGPLVFVLQAIQVLVEQLLPL